MVEVALEMLLEKDGKRSLAIKTYIHLNVLDVADSQNLGLC